MKNVDKKDNVVSHGKPAKFSKEKFKKKFEDNAKENIKDVMPKESVKKKNVQINNFEEIISEYHIHEQNITPKMILDKMTESLEYYIKIIIQILQPEEFHSLHECTVFDDKDKAMIFGMYKNMMILHRELMKSHIKNDQKEMITTIEYAYAEMKGLKPQMLEILHKMQQSWKKTDTNGRVRYFG